MSPHINAPFGTIAPFVLLSGDSVRTKKMSLKFLKNYKLVSETRNMFIYTGYYKGIQVSFATSGIGPSSAALYIYELYKFYQVKVIIRVGTCGALNKNYKLLDMLNVKTSQGVAPFLNYFNSELLTQSNLYLWNCIKKVAQKENKPLFSEVKVLSDNNFYFQDVEKMLAMQKIYDLDAIEMEAYILFLYSQLFHTAAACLLTITDILDLKPKEKGYKTINKISPEERVFSLTSMFHIALETCVLWKKEKIK